MGAQNAKPTSEMTVGQSKRGRERKTYKDNPFMAEVAVKKRIKFHPKENMGLINFDGDAGMGNSAPKGIWEVKEVDGTEFIKIYAKGVALIKELKKAGAVVFEIFCKVVQKEAIGQDQVYMSYAALDDSTKELIAESTYHRGMNELIEKGVLAPTPMVCRFWFNPSYIFNGNRMRFVKDYFKKGTDDAQWANDEIKKLREIEAESSRPMLPFRESETMVEINY